MPTATPLPLQTPGVARSQPVRPLLPPGFGNPAQFGPTGAGGYSSKPGEPFTGAIGGFQGQGLYNLPEAFTGWSSAPRYSFGPALGFSEAAQPAIDYYQGEMGKDYSQELFGLSSDIYEGQQKSERSQREQGLARAGYGGGGAVSPFAALQVQLESQARAGVLGNAARMSVLQAQQMRSEASRSYLNAISQRLQALLTPAMLQTGAQTKQPVGQVGPSIIGPSLNLGASLINAAA